MIGEPHTQLFEAFDHLCDASPRQRKAYLQELRARDPLLSSQLESLLAQDEGHRGNSLLGAVWRSAEDTLAPRREGQRIGPFVLQEQIGRGGMGVVYAALDERLDRRVAVKLIHATQPSPSERTRVVQEARAMAKVVHPNVVTVFETDTHESDVYIAMELIEGSTLREWSAQRPRTWSETIAIYRETAAGLDAAHEAGLVHRDFKPENVLIDARGRPRVADFGLARPTAPSSEQHAGAMPPSLQSLVTDGASAETSSMVGTPAFMAPEQIQGRRTDSRTDQFAFCVALFEALHGIHPFGRGAIAERFRRVLGGELERAPDEPRVPRWLQAVVRRGLRPEPHERWPSMRALVAQLRRRSHRRRTLVGAGVGALSVAAIAVSLRSGAQPQATSEAAASVPALALATPVPPSVTHRCVVAFDRPDYVGEWWSFCPGESAPNRAEWDDRISSVSVPDGVAVRLCTEPSGPNRCIRARQNMPRLPRHPDRASTGIVGFDDQVSRVDWGVLEQTVFSLLIGPPPSSLAQSEVLSAAAADIGFAQLAGAVWIADLSSPALAADEHLPVRYEGGVHGWPGWQGLAGSMCWQGECGPDLVRYVDRAVRGGLGDRFDADSVPSERPKGASAWRGSGAYSWRLGSFRFIQLHDGIDRPTDVLLHTEEAVRLDSAAPWLAQELDRARRAEETVVIFAAEVGIRLRSQLEGATEVAAIFSRNPAEPWLHGRIAMFPSGADEGALLRADFDAGRIMLHQVQRDAHGVTIDDVRHVDIPWGFRGAQHVVIEGHNDRALAGLAPAECAQACDEENDFSCRSFDYNPQTRMCKLSRASSADAPLRWGYEPWIHYEKPPQLDSFAHHPNTSVKDHNRRTMHWSSLVDCMHACEAERDFECRSIDYGRTTGRCNLQPVSGEDVGLERANALYDNYQRLGLKAPVRSRR